MLKGKATSSIFDKNSVFLELGADLFLLPTLFKLILSQLE